MTGRVLDGLALMFLTSAIGMIVFMGLGYAAKDLVWCVVWAPVAVMIRYGLAD